MLTLKKMFIFIALMISFNVQAENYKNIEDFFPQVAKDSFESVKEGRQITVKLDIHLNDAAQAAGYYNDKNEMTQCIISVNPSFDIYQEGLNPFLSMGMTLENIKNLFLVHEIGHCVDGEMPPDGVNLTAWREGFADAFAVAVLYQKHKITYNQIKKTALFRNAANKDFGSSMMLNYIANKINDDNISMQELITKIKQFRIDAFKINPHPEN